MSDNTEVIETGYFDQLGHPRLKLNICGFRDQHPGKKFEALIDTGFTGFIQLPLPVAIGYLFFWREHKRLLWQITQARLC